MQKKTCVHCLKVKNQANEDIELSRQKDGKPIEGLTFNTKINQRQAQEFSITISMEMNWLIHLN